MKTPEHHRAWLDAWPQRVRTGAVDEDGYTERIAQALATDDAGGRAVLTALSSGLRSTVRDRLSGLPLAYVATVRKGPDLVLAVGEGSDPAGWLSVAVEHKRLGNSHARARDYYLSRWPGGDPRADAAPYDFTRRREAFTSPRKEEGMWQLDAVRCYPSDWIPDDLAATSVCGWLFLDAKSRRVDEAYNFGDDPDPSRAAGPPQTSADWDTLGYDALSRRLIAAHTSLTGADAATLVPLLTALYSFPRKRGT